MTSLIKHIRSLTALLLLGPTLHAQEQQPSFFSFVNVVTADTPTTLSVNGKKIGGPEPLGYCASGLGFLEKSVLISIENGDLPKKEGALPLSPENSPIAIAYLKIEPPVPGSDAPPKKSLAIAVIPCSPAPNAGRLRAVYLGGKDPINLTVKEYSRNSAKAPTGIPLKLTPGVAANVPVKGPTVGFFLGDTSIGVQDSEGKENRLLIFYPDLKGQLAFSSTFDFVLH